MGVIGAAMSRSRTVLLGLVVIFVAGLYTYLTIPKEAEPDIEVPLIYVRITHDGISPEDAERLLVRPIEQEIRTVEGIKQMTAEAYEGGASISVEFEAGIDTNRALQDIRERVDSASAEFPSETEDPTINEVKMSQEDPMLVLNLAGDVPERALARIADDLKEKIEGVSGVLEVNLIGKREELMEVVVDPLAMESYGLDQAQIINFVARNNKLVAAGALQTSEGRFPVKVPGVFESPEDVLDLPIKAVGERIVHFSDIAEVRRTYKDAESYARLNGKPALAIEVIQRGGTNLIEAKQSKRSSLSSPRSSSIGQPTSRSSPRAINQKTSTTCLRSCRTACSLPYCSCLSSSSECSVCAPRYWLASRSPAASCSAFC